MCVNLKQNYINNMLESSVSFNGSSDSLTSVGCDAIRAQVPGLWVLINSSPYGCCKNLGVGLFSVPPVLSFH